MITDFPDDDTKKEKQHNKGDAAVTVQTCIKETYRLIFVRFSSVPPGKSRNTLPYNNLRLPPSKSYPVHHS